jgi:hypothetical protein
MCDDVHRVAGKNTLPSCKEETSPCLLKQTTTSSQSRRFPTFIELSEAFSSNPSHSLSIANETKYSNIDQSFVCCSSL